VREKVADVLQVLERFPHNGFPVVDPDIEIQAFERESLRRSKSRDKRSQELLDASSVDDSREIKISSHSPNIKSSVGVNSDKSDFDGHDTGIGWQGDGKRRVEEANRGWLTLCGLILRQELMVLLAARVWLRGKCVENMFVWFFLERLGFILS
jgi:hypothetical protein